MFAGSAGSGISEVGGWLFTLVNAISLNLNSLIPNTNISFNLNKINNTYLILKRYTDK